MRRVLGGSIHRHTLFVSLLPAVLIAFLLTGYFTLARLHSLQDELADAGQLIADQLAPAAEFSVISGNIDTLEPLLQGLLKHPHIAFIEIYDNDNQRLLRSDKNPVQSSITPTFQAQIIHQMIELDPVFLSSTALAPTSTSNEEVIGRVVIGMTDSTLNQQQLHTLLRALWLIFLALSIIWALAYLLARSLSTPIQGMRKKLQALGGGNYNTAPLAEIHSGELGKLTQHINMLSRTLKQAQSAQQKYTAELKHAQHKAERADKAKSDFLAMMSHELRTPMNGVLGMLQLLEQTELSTEQAEYTHIAHNSSVQMLDVINDILDFSRLEHDVLQLECIAFSLSDIFTSLHDTFKYSAEQKDIELVFVLPDALHDIQVEGDPTRLQQILVNLLANALKFTLEGSVTLRVDWILPGHSQLLLKCEISDSGIGIANEQLNSIFNAFHQADQSISRRYGGTGLGLSIAYTLARQMGGDLRVLSQAGQGSTFTLEIPLHHI
ncbi:MAG TPA: ATP-binding protein [Thiopseudomonas sp.]|nr:ATP-binding protein [Thiopseudomonas sp.]